MKAPGNDGLDVHNFKAIISIVLPENSHVLLNRDNAPKDWHLVEEAAGMDLQGSIQTRPLEYHPRRS